MPVAMPVAMMADVYMAPAHVCKIMQIVLVATPALKASAVEVATGHDEFVKRDAEAALHVKGSAAPHHACEQGVRPS